MTSYPNPILAPATGTTTARTTSSHFADRVNVLDFGADPSGRTDSKNAINAAIVYLSGIGGGDLFFGPGSFLVSASINLLPNVNLIGSGKLVSRIFTNTPSINIISASNVNTYGIKIQGLWIYGPAAPPSSTGTGLYIDSTPEFDGHLFLEDIRFENLAYGINNGSGTYALFDSLLIKCDFIDIVAVGANFGGSGVTCLGCTFRVCGYGVELTYVNAGSVAGVRFYGCTWIGNTFDIVDNGVKIRPTTFDGCWFEQCVTGVFATATGGAQYLQTVTFQGCLFQPSATATVNGGIMQLNTITGILRFTACIVDRSLYASATLPDASDARLSGANVSYSREGCTLLSAAGVVSQLSDSNSNWTVNILGVFTNRKYANDAAAGSGGLVQGDMYYNTTIPALSLKN